MAQTATGPAETGTDLTVHLFGGFRLTNGDGKLVQLRSRKAEALLVTLAVSHPETLQRDRLIDLLWGDMPTDRARASLRQSLSIVRREAGVDPFEIPQQGWLKLDPAQVGCDLWSARALCAGTSDPALDVSEGFLEFVPRPTPRFDEWLSDRENELKHELRGGAVRVLGSDGTVGADGFRPGICRLLTSLDPNDEDAAVAIIKHCFRHGQVEDGERFRQRYMERVSVEMGESIMEISARLPRPPEPSRTTPSVQAGNGAATPADSDRFVSVEPLRNMSKDKNYDYFGEAFAEELIVGLSQQSWFNVIASGLPASYKPPGVIAGEGQGHEGYQLSGSYILSDTAIRLTLRLTNRATSEVAWAQQFDAPRADILDIGASIVTGIVSTISSQLVTIATAEASRDTRTPIDLDDWSRVMQARHLFWRTSRENNARARELLDISLDRNPDYIPALTTAAFAHMLEVWSFWSSDPGGNIQKAVTLAQRAVRCDARDPWAHFTLGTALGVRNRLNDGLDSLDQALSLQPSLTAALGEQARLKLFIGHYAEAEADAVKSIGLNSSDPHQGLWFNTAGQAAFFAGRFDEARDWAKKAMKANPYWYHNHILMVLLDHERGEHSACAEHFKLVRKTVPDISRAGLITINPFRDEDMMARFLAPLEAVGLE